MRFTVYTLFPQLVEAWRQEALIGRIHRNVAANHLRNVHTIMAAAGDRTGFVTVPKSGTPSTGVKLAGSGNLVPMIRLDDYFAAALTPTTTADVDE